MTSRWLLMFILMGLLLRIGYVVNLYEPSLLNYYLDDWFARREGAERECSLSCKYHISQRTEASASP